MYEVCIQVDPIYLFFLSKCCILWNVVWPSEMSLHLVKHHLRETSLCFVTRRSIPFNTSHALVKLLCFLKCVCVAFKPSEPLWYYAQSTANPQQPALNASCVDTDGTLTLQLLLKCSFHFEGLCTHYTSLPFWSIYPPPSPPRHHHVVARIASKPLLCSGGLKREDSKVTAGWKPIQLQTRRIWDMSCRERANHHRSAERSLSYWFEGVTFRSCSLCIKNLANKLNITVLYIEIIFFLGGGESGLFLLKTWSRIFFSF